MKPQANAKAKPTKPGPGLLRMKAKLGPAKTEALRQTVLRDQANATSAAKPPASGPKAAPETAPAKLAELKSAKASAPPPDAGAKITLLVKENPHGTGTKDRAKFALVAANLTVGAALAAGVDRGYLNYMSARKLLEIG